MIARKTIVSSAVFAAISAMTQNAIAQGTLEEVVVTAQKRAQSITDVGITINAFSNETLKDLGINNVVDIAAHTPGLIYNEAGGLGVPVYTIRGVGFDQPLHLRINPIDRRHDNDRGDFVRTSGKGQAAVIALPLSRGEGDVGTLNGHGLTPVA